MDDSFELISYMFSGVATSRDSNAGEGGPFRSVALVEAARRGARGGGGGCVSLALVVVAARGEGCVLVGGGGGRLPPPCCADRRTSTPCKGDDITKRVNDEAPTRQLHTVVSPLLSLEVAAPENICIHWKLTSMSKKVRTRRGSSSRPFARTKLLLIPVTRFK